MWCDVKAMAKYLGVLDDRLDNTTVGARGDNAIRTRLADSSRILTASILDGVNLVPIAESRPSGWTEFTGRSKSRCVILLSARWSRLCNTLYNSRCLLRKHSFVLP